MIAVKFHHLQVIMMTKNMPIKISHTKKQAVDTPVEKCVVHNNNEDIRYEKS